MANSAKFTLKGDDAALIMRGDGEIELLVPDGEPGERVPEHVVLLMAIAGRLDSDPDFCDDLIEKMKGEVARQLGVVSVRQH